MRIERHVPEHAVTLMGNDAREQSLRLDRVQLEVASGEELFDKVGFRTQTQSECPPSIAPSMVVPLRSQPPTSRGRSRRPVAFAASGACAAVP